MLISTSVNTFYNESPCPGHVGYQHPCPFRGCRLPQLHNHPWGDVGAAAWCLPASLPIIRAPAREYSIGSVSPECCILHCRYTNWMHTTHDVQCSTK